MSKKVDAIQILNDWYKGLKTYADKLPSKGSIACALHVLNRLRTKYDLNISSHVAGGEAQITGLSATAVKRVLAEFGETRTLSAIGGRTNRGARGDLTKLLDALKWLKLDSLDEPQRRSVLIAMQDHIVKHYVSRFFSVKRVKALFDTNSATIRFIETIIKNAHQSRKAGPVAEHLVGAKLALRYPLKKIRNKPFSTGDVQGGHSGDFKIGNTTFHVTTSSIPPELTEKLKSNLEQGLRVYLVVLKSQAVGVEQLVEGWAPGRITVVSIEGFVAQNVDELAEFDGHKLKSGFRRLLDKYNARVEKIEADKSLLIEIPPNLT